MKKNQYSIVAVFSIVLFIGIFVLMLNEAFAANIIGTNYRNATVKTSVNITNSRPDVSSVVVYQDTNVSAKNITLSAGLTRTVTCNATIRDWQGFSDVTGVNATLWDVANANMADADNNNTHYTNASCTNAGNGLNFTVNYICQFNVYYYANNGTWRCNVTAKDTYNKTGSNANTTIFYPLYALNVTDGIDYGNVATDEYSGNATANITNFGNMPINISLEGYGATRGDGLAMNCSLNGNISIANERFSLSDVAWGSKTALTGSTQSLTGLTIQKQTTPGSLMVNTTYWQLYVDPATNPGGNCTGYVIFSAEAP